MNKDAEQKQELTLGEKLRARRKQRKFTMQTVADEAGLSVGFISQVERNLTVPSLASLASISKVLGEHISRFLDQPKSESETTHHSNRISYAVGNQGHSYERLSANFPGSTLRSVLVHEKPGSPGEPISHTGEELMLILKGQVTVELDGRRTILNEGDSIHFDSRRTHSTWNHTTEVTTIMWCGTMDIFGEGEPDPIHKKQI